LEEVIRNWYNQFLKIILFKHWAAQKVNFHPINYRYCRLNCFLYAVSFLHMSDSPVGRLGRKSMQHLILPFNLIKQIIWPASNGPISCIKENQLTGQTLVLSR
jgi:hypothetical protein